MPSLNPQRRPWPLTRWLAGRIWRDRIGVRATEDLSRLDSAMRFGGLYALTILGPILLLGYFGVADLLSGEASLMSEVTREADDTISACAADIEEIFDHFETATRNRLLAGRSLVEAPGEISSHLLLSLRLDAEGNITAPFERSEAAPPGDHTFFLTGPFAEGRRVEDQNPPLAAALYRTAAQRAPGVASEGAAVFQHARALALSGHQREAEAAYADVIADFGNVRDVWGFRLGDLASLKRGELILQREPEIGVGALKSVVDDILGRTWTIGQGGEPALARRALALMEGLADVDWLASRRSRVDMRSHQLYWAERLQPELAPLTAGGHLLQIAPGRFRYTLGEEALWAVAWFDGELYAFALQRTGLFEAFRAAAVRAPRGGSPVQVELQAPDAVAPESTLARRSLAPWLPGWTVVAKHADPKGLAATIRWQRTRRIVLVAAAILLVGLGGLITGRLVARELDLARLKTSFAANVSHELRSPITQIRLKGESLQLDLVEDEADRRQHYDAIVRESERLSRLVDNVLDFAAIERGTKNYMLRPADLATTLRNAAQAMKVSMEIKGLTFDADIPDELPLVEHDQEAIAQALTNLLSNAAKYGGQGKWIGLSTSVLPDGVEIHVADKGIGIDRDEVPKIFDMYYRSQDPRARSLKGTGIGLAIVKYIMEAHGGLVTVSSTPGRGSVFTLFLPFSRSPRRE
ncbi:MAG: HAMP domain-containing sensor histidine kinase [Pseudomonadota bacterium]